MKIYNNSNNKLPEYKTNGSVGMDLHADFSRIKKIEDFKIANGNIDYNDNKLLIYPNTRVLIPTGLHISLNDNNLEAQIRPRSGASFKDGIDVILGTIDSDFTGEIHIIVRNINNEPIIISHSDRIAQLVINKVEKINWKEVFSLDDLDKTERGMNGFGHTGK